MPGARSWLLAVALLVAPIPARPAAAAPDAATVARLRGYKSLEHRILLAGASAKAQRLERARATWREPERRRRFQALGSRPPRDPAPAIEPRARRPGPSGRSRAGDVPPIDHQMNEAIGATGATQSEVTIAARGDLVLGAWNDADQTPDGPSGIGYGWSTDGGETWTDGGALPRAGPIALWLSDPVLTVNERTGAFYLSGIVITGLSTNGIGVIRGGFDAGGFHWEVPRLARAVRDTFPDKPWIAADSLSGRLYLSYTTFFKAGDVAQDQIEFQTALDPGGPWTPPLRLSTSEESGLVQGSRPVVGPDEELHVVWKTIDTTSTSDGRDFVRLSTSRDRGKTFTGPVDVAGVFSNFASGAPGYNRGNGIAFPAIAVDRSSGPHRGRVYVAWNESLDFYDDALGGGAGVSEVEPNETRATAMPFAPGDVLRGDADGGYDLYRFHATRGQTVVAYADSVADSLDVAFRLWCGDLATQLAFSAPVRIPERLLIFTVPEDGDYFLSVYPIAGGVASAYRVVTGLAAAGTERGRDHRDVFVTTSDDGVAWSEPARVNDDPPWFDDWLPEVAVSAEGRAYAVWYDWRDSPAGTCGGVSRLGLARSSDGGATWWAQGPVSSEGTDWSTIIADLVPNQGDYVGLFANEHAVYACWADGRDGQPDAWMAAWPLGLTAARVALVSVLAEPGRVTLVWSDASGEITRADVERREPGGRWDVVGSTTADGLGRLAFVDATVARGARYGYRLAASDWRGDEVLVDVPAAVERLAIVRVHPNPAGRELVVSYALPWAAPARVALIDAGGRRVREVALPDVAGAGRIDLAAGAALPAGVYVVRLEQGGRVASAKVAVVR